MNAPSSRPRIRTLGLVAVLVAASACAQAPEATSTQPGAADTPPGQTASSDRPQAQADRAEVSGMDGLDPDVRACLSAYAIEDNQGRTYYEVARERGTDGLFVYLATVAPNDRTAEVESVLLLFQDDGTCVSMLDLEGVFYSFDEAAPEDVAGNLSAAFDRWVATWRRGMTP